MFFRCSLDVLRMFAGFFQDVFKRPRWVLWAWWNLMIISIESMDFNDPKEFDDPQLFDDLSYRWWSCFCPFDFLLSPLILISTLLFFEGSRCPAPADWAFLHLGAFQCTGWGWCSLGKWSNKFWRRRSSPSPPLPLQHPPPPLPWYIVYTVCTVLTLLGGTLC